MEQEGYIGLIKAIKAYKPNTEATFTTFANLCIRRQLTTTIKKLIQTNIKFLMIL
ncbi:sigma factor [Cetobacterium sp. NK01]|uniref:sigma factor n=1 Tax=Cetobacterium sp. NK01 TaxID=2993530 RepID=UPI0039B6FEA3